VCHHVNRIGSHNQHGLRRVLQYRRHHLTENLRVALEKREASFSGFLPDARTKQNDTTAFQIAVVTGADLKRMSKGMA
jgi:hypothetical protein